MYTRKCATNIPPGGLGRAAALCPCPPPHPPVARVCPQRPRQHLLFGLGRPSTLMSFPLGVWNSRAAGRPMPSRSSFLLALEREGKQRQSLRIIPPQTCPNQGPEPRGHQQPLPASVDHPSCRNGTVLGKEAPMTVNVTFHGKDVLVSEGHPALPSSEAQAPETLPKPVWPRAQSPLKTGHKVPATSAPSPMHRGWCRKEWVGPKPHQTGDSPLLQEQLPQPPWVPITAPQLALIRVGPGIHPGPGDFLDRCHASGRCPQREAVQTSPTTGLGPSSRAQGLLNGLRLPLSLSLWRGADNESFPASYGQAAEVPCPPPCSCQAWETPAGEIKPQTHLLLSTPLPPGPPRPGRGLSPG